MCGIFGWYSYSDNDPQVNMLLHKEFMKIQHRGPDQTSFKEINNKLVLGFHRLAIVDLRPDAMQPIVTRGSSTTVIANCEIYNFKQLIEEYDLEPSTQCDAEVISLLYDKLGDLQKVLPLLDGVFALLLWDDKKKELFAARDPFGVRPLFFGRLNDYSGVVFASELKAISDIAEGYQYPPCGYTNVTTNTSHCYYDKYAPKIEWSPSIVPTIRSNLVDAVRKRLMSDRPVGFLLSGGLDSSLVAAIGASLLRGKTINTFTIGLEGSPDIKYASIVATHIKSKHHTILPTKQEFLDAIPEVIKCIESYDVTTVRASVGNYLIGKYIKENTNITVVFNGDGSDEQSGYKYLAKAPDEEAFDKECKHLIDHIHYFDVLRSDRCISSQWSLEARTPFLDKKFVKHYMSIPSCHKMYPNQGSNQGVIEKHLLRQAFEGTNILPNEVLWRSKEAFSDGVSSNDEESWHKIIERHVETIEDLPEYKNNGLMTKEARWYRKLFDEYYPNHEHVIPFYWMPKWHGDVVDPSARVLV